MKILNSPAISAFGGLNFVAASGMLSQRSKQYLKTGGTQHTDAFTYDNLYRLTGWTVSQTNQTNVAYTMDYSNNGNLVQKSDIGFYDYASTQPHAVTSVSQLSGDAFSTKYNKITYNSFNSVAKAELSATQGGAVTNTYTLTYGPNNQRRISNSDGAETIYTGLYEVRSNGNKLHYIPTPDGLCGLIVTNGTTQTNYYLHNDHLGSLVAEEAQDGTLTEFSYDPWGRRRSSTNWNDYNVTIPTLFTRGFTGHSLPRNLGEHMDAYGLINMNGRVYDPRLGRMLSPDNNIQAPDFSQSFNRYSYCLNNPLMFTDPSGESWRNFMPWLVKTGNKLSSSLGNISGNRSFFGGLGIMNPDEPNPDPYAEERVKLEQQIIGNQIILPMYYAGVESQERGDNFGETVGHVLLTGTMGVVGFMGPVGYIVKNNYDDNHSQLDGWLFEGKPYGNLRLHVGPIGWDSERDDDTWGGIYTIASPGLSRHERIEMGTETVLLLGEITGDIGFNIDYGRSKWVPGHCRGFGGEFGHWNTVAGNTFPVFIPTSFIGEGARFMEPYMLAIDKNN